MDMTKLIESMKKHSPDVIDPKITNLSVMENMIKAKIALLRMKGYSEEYISEAIDSDVETLWKYIEQHFDLEEI